MSGLGSVVEGCCWPVPARKSLWYYVHKQGETLETFFFFNFLQKSNRSHLKNLISCSTWSHALKPDLILLLGYYTLKSS